MSVLPIHSRLAALLPGHFVTISTPLHFVGTWSAGGFGGWVHVAGQHLLIFSAKAGSDPKESSLVEVWRYEGEPASCLPIMERIVMGFLENHRKRTESGRASRATRDDHFAKEWPSLFEMMTVTAVGKATRLTATLNVFCEEGLFKCFLNDREFDQSVCLSHRTLLGVLGALEGGLLAGDLPWRTQKGKGKK